MRTTCIINLINKVYLQKSSFSYSPTITDTSFGFLVTFLIIKRMRSKTIIIIIINTTNITSDENLELLPYDILAQLRFDIILGKNTRK